MTHHPEVKGHGNSLTRPFCKVEVSHCHVSETPSGFIKRGWLENPRTEWRFLARKITDFYGFYGPCFIAMFDDRMPKSRSWDIHRFLASPQMRSDEMSNPMSSVHYSTGPRDQVSTIELIKEDPVAMVEEM